MDRSWPAWSAPVRTERRNVAAPAGAPAELVALAGGRFRSCVLVLRGPLAWSTAAHALVVRAENGPTRAAALSTTLDLLDWQALGAGLVEAVVSVHDRPCSGFVVELTPATALDGGSVVLEASADAAAFGDVAERADQPIDPRSAPLLRGVLLGVDTTTGKLRPLAVSASGEIESS